MPGSIPATSASQIDYGGFSDQRKRKKSRRLRARRKKEWGLVEAAAPNQIWQSDMTKIWAGPAIGWAYLVCVIDCCTREIVGWDLSRRCRTEEVLAAVEQAVLSRLPTESRDANLTLPRNLLRRASCKRFPGWASRRAERRISIRREQLHRTVPSQLEGGGSLGVRVSQHRRGARVDRTLDRGVQSQPAPSKSAKSNASRGVLSLGSYTTFRGRKCSVLRVAVQQPSSPSLTQFA